MATNTIALLAKPVDIDPLEVPTKQANLRALSLTNQGDALKLDAARQGLADDASARVALQADPTGGTEYLKGLAGAGNVKGYFAGLKANADNVKALADANKDKATADKTGVETINLRTARYRDALGTVGDKASAAAWVQAMYSDPHLGPVLQQETGSVDQALARIPDPATDPAGFAAWKRGSQLGADKLVELTAPKLGTRDLGDHVETTLTDPITGQVQVTGQGKKAQTPDSVASQETIRRGQNMTDARARESNKTQLAIAGMGPDGQLVGDVDAMARGIAAGKLPGLSSFAIAKPRGQAIMARVTEINPDYDAGDYLAKNQALRGFSNGKEGTALRSFNVAQDHLETLGQMADALDNGNSPLLNKIGNLYAKQTGGSAPTNFAAVKEIVAKEVVKAIVAGGGGVAEREELSNLMNQANSPAQLKGVIAHFHELMDAQKAGLMDQYERTTGRKDGERVFAAKRHAGNEAAPVANTGATNSKGWTLHQDAKGNKAYVSPDGKQFEEVK